MLLIIFIIHCMNLFICLFTARRILHNGSKCGPVEDLVHGASSEHRTLSLQRQRTHGEDVSNCLEGVSGACLCIFKYCIIDNRWTSSTCYHDCTKRSLICSSSSEALYINRKIYISAVWGYINLEYDIKSSDLTFLVET